MSLGNSEMVVHMETCEKCMKNADGYYNSHNDEEKSKLAEEMLKCFGESL